MPARCIKPRSTVEGETGSYPSSATLDRVFCKACGTRLFSWRKNGDRRRRRIGGIR